VKRILIDTSVYVDWFRARGHEEIIMGHRGPPSLSAVVAMELLAGAGVGRALADWMTRFRRAGRLLVPDWEVWRIAGRVLRELGRRGTSAQALTNDVLIAMTARSQGMKLFTSNARDFNRIAAIEGFDLEIVSPKASA
jgi:predicted nucleic acid-binding protein